MRVRSNNTPIFGRVEPNEGNVNGVYSLKRLEEALDTPARINRSLNRVNWLQRMRERRPLPPQEDV
jgi:hypothetical protein